MQGETQALYRNLIAEKYTQEYKLDRKTRVRAEEILNDYFARNSHAQVVRTSPIVSITLPTGRNSDPKPPLSTVATAVPSLTVLFFHHS